jgi:nicotinate-nucleotide--dimethylbenzimidazole phosphoribosyltransferase
MNLEELTRQIAPLDQKSMGLARERQGTLTKPRGSLGRLEELSIRLAGIMGNPGPRVEHKVVLVMAGDHGVVDEGVSAYPSEVTGQMVQNFLHGRAAINAFARQAEARVTVVDMGIAANVPEQPGLIIRKIGPGTRNLARGPAMSREQAIESILAGAEIAEAELRGGADLMAMGDMGIGNSTAAAAIAAALTGRAAAELAGRGTGVDDEGLERKVFAIWRGLEINRPDASDGLDVLAKVGGFEIGGLTGAILAAAGRRRPVIIDGFISTSAAMVAVSLASGVRDYLIAGHVSAEKGHRLMLDWLQLEPLLDLRMHLGEGTGAVLAMGLVEAACRSLTEMATFSEAGVSGKSDETAPT